MDEQTGVFCSLLLTVMNELTVRNQFFTVFFTFESNIESANLKIANELHTSTFEFESLLAVEYSGKCFHFNLSIG